MHQRYIVFAEYTERNREVLQMWIDKEPKSFDFTPFLICCDLPFLVPSYEGPYNIILCSLSLLAALGTEE